MAPRSLDQKPDTLRTTLLMHKFTISKTTKSSRQLSQVLFNHFVIMKIRTSQKLKCDFKLLCHFVMKNFYERFFLSIVYYKGLNALRNFPKEKKRKEKKEKKDKLLGGAYFGFTLLKTMKSRYIFFFDSFLELEIRSRKRLLLCNVVFFCVSLYIITPLLSNLLKPILIFSFSHCAAFAYFYHLLWSIAPALFLFTHFWVNSI